MPAGRAAEPVSTAPPVTFIVTLGAGAKIVTLAGADLITE